MTSRARVFMWTDIRPSFRDYKIGKMQASWYKLVIRHAQQGRDECFQEQDWLSLGIQMIINNSPGTGRCSS
jgi:hypothetical protein